MICHSTCKDRAPTNNKTYKIPKFKLTVPNSNDVINTFHISKSLASGHRLFSKEGLRNNCQGSTSQKTFKFNMYFKLASQILVNILFSYKNENKLKEKFFFHS